MRIKHLYGWARLSWATATQPARQTRRGPFPRRGAAQLGHGRRVGFWLGICLQQAGEQGHGTPTRTKNICWGGELQGCKTHRGVQVAAHKLEGCSKGLWCKRQAVKYLQLGSVLLSYFSFTLPYYSGAAARAVFTFQGFCERVTSILPPSPWTTLLWISALIPTRYLLWQTVIHINICACQSCWFKGIIPICKDRGKGNSG